MNELCLSTLSLPIGSLDAYIDRVNRIPMLSEQEEMELGLRLIEHGDLKSAQKLVMAHLKYVVKIAKNYIGYGLQLADLIQEGTIGLMKAVKKFDPLRGARLATFAMHWIKSEIHEFVIKNWRIVKIATTKAQRKIFFNLRSSTQQNLELSDQEKVHAIAKSLEVKNSDVIQMEQRLSANDLPLLGSDDEDHFAPINYLESYNADPARNLLSLECSNNSLASLMKNLKTLSVREQEILQARWLQEEKAPLKELADKHKVSVERVRQIENSALHKLHALMMPDFIS